MSEAKEVPCNFEFKQGSLKDILEELGKLYTTTSTRHKVFQQLRDGLKTYCGTAYLEAFYGSRGSGYGSGGSIQALTQAAEGICKAIINNPSWTFHITDPHVSHKGQDCAERIANALKECLPKTFAALFFLFFNVSTECSGIGGGSWNSYSVKGSGKDLYNWLTDQDGSDDLPRKFSQEDLNTSNTGNNVAGELKKAVSLTPSSTEGSLQNVLCGFLFVCSWDDALTGHACLFLHKFCDEVSGDSVNAFRVAFEEKYSGKKYEELKGECKTLKSQLDSLVNGTSKLSAVCHGNTKLFDGIWDDKNFDKYCTWLKENLHYIIQSLEKMSEKCKQWSSPLSYEGGATAGPFLYGFVPKDSSWTSGSTSMSKLQGYISKLVNSDSGSLNSLLKCLKGDFSANSERLTTESTQSSSGATAAGGATAVLGIGGAGAGAAYGLNLFGFKNLVTGLISSFLK
ncbi:secreted antigen 3 [Babesia divergens]|uniref:Secreted antigen 3 n=1 Tax=Babesia divergens TaxID=32595 RepID=A0AAD9LF49_BABDI|nr:secreted antigen 3 [Babesia divergens]